MTTPTATPAQSPRTPRIPRRTFTGPARIDWQQTLGLAVAGAGGLLWLGELAHLLASA